MANINRLRARNQNRKAKADSWHSLGSPSFLNGGDNYEPQGYAPPYQVNYQTYTAPAPVDYCDAGGYASSAYPEVPYPQFYGRPVDSYYLPVPPQCASNEYGMYSYGSIQQGSYGCEYEPPYPPYDTTNVSGSMYHQVYNNPIPAQSSYTYSQAHYQQYPPQSLNAHSSYGVGGPIEPTDHAGTGGATSQCRMSPQELIARLKAYGHIA